MIGLRQGEVWNGHLGKWESLLEKKNRVGGCIESSFEFCNFNIKNDHCI